MFCLLQLRFPYRIGIYRLQIVNGLQKYTCTMKLTHEFTSFCVILNSSSAVDRYGGSYHVDFIIQ